MYAQSHRAKVGPWREQLARADDPTDTNNFMSPEVRELHETRIADTIRKAEENERLCREVQAIMDEDTLQLFPADVLKRTAEFGTIAYADGISPKNQQTQLGVHFEEVAEMIEQLDGLTISDQEIIGSAFIAMKRLGDHFKNSYPGIYRIKSRLLFLDSVCDQLVTVTLSAVLHDMDPVGGLHEVNRSNYSKLVDGVMEKAPITAKWIKGPNFFEPDLTPFV